MQTNSQDPRNMVGQNPTKNPRKSSAGTRRKKARSLERDLIGTRWERK